MKRYAILIVALMVMLAADPASSWFWEKKEVKAPAATTEVIEGPKSSAQEETKPVKNKGLWNSIKETGRDIGGFFKKAGKDTKESAKQVPGEAKKEGKAIGQSFKHAGKTIGEESKKGGKAVGQGFKDLGKDIKDSSKKAFVGE